MSTIDSIILPNTNTPETFINFFNMSGFGFGFGLKNPETLNNQYKIFYETVEKSIGYEFDEGIRKIYDTRNLQYIINDKPYNIKILLLKEYYKFMGQYYSDGVGLCLYSILHNKNKMFIVVPMFWGKYANQFIPIDTNTQNKINQIEKSKNQDSLLAIKNELVNNFLLKTTNFKEFYNIDEAFDFIKYTADFWDLSDDFSIIVSKK